MRHFSCLTLIGLMSLTIAKQKSGLQVNTTLAKNCSKIRQAREGDKVTVHYGGFLQDGKKFDSSFDRAQPFTFTLGIGQVIPGWDKGLLGVCKGEERHLVVPAPLAYGDRGAGDVIPPGATLLFDIVIVDVERVESDEEKRHKAEAEAALLKEQQARAEEKKRREEEEEARRQELIRREDEKEARRQELIRREEEEKARRQELLRREEDKEARRQELLRREDEEEARRQELIRREEELQRRRRVEAKETRLAEERRKDLERRKEAEQAANRNQFKEGTRRKEEEDEDYSYYEEYYYDDVSNCPAGELEMQVTYSPPRCRKTARSGDQLTMHYTGKLSSGLKFDSSLDRNKPFKFTLGVGQVIAGWDSGLEGMCVGERRTLVIPPDLAYGEQGVGTVIPSCSTLVFDVELIDIE